MPDPTQRVYRFGITAFRNPAGQVQYKCPFCGNYCRDLQSTVSHVEFTHSAAAMSKDQEMRKTVWEGIEAPVEYADLLKQADDLLNDKHEPSLPIVEAIRVQQERYVVKFGKYPTYVMLTAEMFCKLKDALLEAKLFLHHADLTKSDEVGCQMFAGMRVIQQHQSHPVMVAGDDAVPLSFDERINESDNESNETKRASA